MAVAQSSSSRVTKSQGEGVVLRVFLPTDNALYSIAFGTHTKTAEPIEVPFGMMTRVGCRYHVLDGGPDPPRARGNFGEREKHNNVAAMFAAKGIIQSPMTSCSRRDHSVCKASTNRNMENSERKRCGLSAGKGVMVVHSVGEVRYLRLPCLHVR